MERPTNLAFGGSDGRTVYVVGRCIPPLNISTGCIDSFRAPYPGRAFRFLHPETPTEEAPGAPEAPQRPTTITPTIAPTSIQPTAPSGTSRLGSLTAHILNGLFLSILISKWI